MICSDSAISQRLGEKGIKDEKLNLRLVAKLELLKSTLAAQCIRPMSIIL